MVTISKINEQFNRQFINPEKWQPDMVKIPISDEYIHEKIDNLRKNKEELLQSERILKQTKAKIKNLDDIIENINDLIVAEMIAVECESV